MKIFIKSKKIIDSKVEKW